MATKQTKAKPSKAAEKQAEEVRQSLVSERAIAQRINRALNKRGQKLIKSKGPRQVATLGAWHIADEGRGEIVAKDVNLVEIARDEGLLQPWEGIYVVADAGQAPKAATSTYHPVIGYLRGTMLRGAGGLTHEQAIKAAQVLADKCEHDDEIDFVGAGIDRVLTSHVEK